MEPPLETVLAMRSLNAKTTRLTELNWLAEIQEFPPPLGPDSPIWMRETQLHMNAALPGRERHPYCEIALFLEGEGTAFLEGTEARFAEETLRALNLVSANHDIRFKNGRQWQ